MIGARGEDTARNSLEKFATAGRPQRIELEIVGRIRELGADRLSQEVRDSVVESCSVALETLKGADPTEFGRTPSLRCNDGEMWINKLERSLINLLGVLPVISSSSLTLLCRRWMVCTGALTSPSPFNQ